MSSIPPGVNTSQFLKQKELFFKIQKAGFNICTCGQCGSIVLGQLDNTAITEDIEMSCSSCGFTGEACDFPDLYF